MRQESYTIEKIQNGYIIGNYDIRVFSETLDNVQGIIDNIDQKVEECREQYRAELSKM